MKQKGFTLVELLTVVLIIGVLVSVALPQYTKSVRRAEMSEGLTQGKTIYDAALRYRSEAGVSPNNFDTLDVAFFGAETTGPSFDDGNFTYVLNTNYVSAVNSKDGGYEIRFMYPIEDNSGVYAPVLCCPSDNHVCKSAGQAGCTPGVFASGCTEIK